jgi:hypothetical protein
MRKPKNKQQDRQRRLTRIIQSEVGFFNGWAVTDAAEWQACAKASARIMRLLSRWAAAPRKGHKHA